MSPVLSSTPTVRDSFGAAASSHPSRDGVNYIWLRQEFLSCNHFMLISSLGYKRATVFFCCCCFFVGIVSVYRWSYLYRLRRFISFWLLFYYVISTEDIAISDAKLLPHECDSRPVSSIITMTIAIRHKYNRNLDKLFMRSLLR